MPAAEVERATLTLCMVPGEDEELKSGIFHRVLGYLDTVQAVQPAYTEDCVLEEADCDSRWDEERIREVIEDRLAEFAQGEFAEINRIVKKCLKKHRGEEP